MALLLPLPHPTGALPEYWRILQAVVHYDRQEVVIDVAGYLSAEARSAGAQPITSMQIIMTVDQFPDIRAMLYDALDVIESPLMDAQDLI